MMTIAVGQCLTTPSQTDFTIPTLILRRSIRSMPGLRGTPDVMTTTSLPAIAE